MPHRQSLQAALITLITLQIIMLLSLFAGVAPHPPAATPLFGIGPFIGLAVSVALAALVLGDSTAGKSLAGFAALCALVSFGPQKYFDAQFPLIWPAVLGGQVAVVVIALGLVRPASRQATQVTTTRATV